MANNLRKFVKYLIYKSLSENIKIIEKDKFYSIKKPPINGGSSIK